MPELTPEIVESVLAACTEGAEEAGEAFSRALDAQIGVAVGPSETFQPATPPDSLAGPGLLVALLVGSTGALVLLPEDSGLLPAWYADPDPTGRSKLVTLAQELGMLVLPEEFMPEDAQAGHVADLAKALGRAGVGEGAGVVSLELSAEESSGIARLIWPVSDPAAGLKPQAADSSAAADEPSKREANPEAAPTLPAAQPPAAVASEHRATSIGELPDYTRSLLRIKVPVVVTLAQKRQPLRRIVEIGAGSIIQFEKSCEEMLELSVGGHCVATGEAVKVGDKFGLRIQAMVMPEERFRPLRPNGGGKLGRTG